MTEEKADKEALEREAREIFKRASESARVLESTPKGRCGWLRSLRPRLSRIVATVKHEPKPLDELLSRRPVPPPVRILCAALHLRDGKVRVHQPVNVESGIVICGRRHHNCFTALNEFVPGWKDDQVVQGFLTSDDRFVERKEAMGIAERAGQLLLPAGGVLVSEDLY